MKALGIHRNKKFSPNHIGNDEAIFLLTAENLKKFGVEVTICSEQEFLENENVDFRYIFTMARKKKVVKRLHVLEKQGVTVVNSGFGIENCYRTNMTEGLINNGIPHPKCFVVPTDYNGDEIFDQLPGKGFWIKRGDFHAIHKEDVTFAGTRAEGKEILKEYARRGIPDAVISEHLAGDLVKFYGVRGTSFFYWFYPYDNNHHKYAEYESINGQSHHYPFNENSLKKISDQAAAALNVDIYGGDAIVGKDGLFHIIDLNDWPSFAPCRELSAPFIAERIFHHFKMNQIQHEKSIQIQS